MPEMSTTPNRMAPGRQAPVSSGRRALKALVVLAAIMAMMAVTTPLASAVSVDPPSACTFTRQGDVATVTFKPSTDRDAAFHIIERNRNNIGWGWADRIDPNEKPVHVNRVKAKDSVRFRVRALSSDRTSSRQVTCKEEQALPPRLAPVKNLRVTNSTATSVTLGWQVDGDPRQVSYDFFVNNRWVGYDPNEKVTSHTFEGLEPNTSYTLGVTVVGDKNGDWVKQSYSRRINIKAKTSGSATEKVVFRDDFNSLDTSVWKLEDDSTFGDGNKEEQCYIDDNVAVRGGKLVLTAKSQDIDCFYKKRPRNFTSGMVRSRGVTFGVGQAIEFRVKLTPADNNNQGGLWPALWVSEIASDEWPFGGEIDFLEVMTAIDPKRSLYSLHYSTTAPPVKTRGIRSKPFFDDKNFSDQWHVIRFENRLGDLRWFIDGKQTYRVTSAPTYQGWPAPFDQPAREIRMNLALGGELGGKQTVVDPRALGANGATFMIDYVQISELTN